MDKFELIQELWELYKRKSAIEKELKDYFQLMAEREATFQIGETVTVYAGEGSSVVAEGIVHKIFHGLNYGYEAFEVKQYCENPEKFKERLSDIRYGVRAIRLDGTPSLRNVFGRASYDGKEYQDRPHIKKKS